MKAIVYSSLNCVYCGMVKNFLASHNIPFEEVDIDKDPTIVQKLLDHTGMMGIPQVEISGQWIVGYQPNQFLKVWDLGK